jgi:hypothetical protein
MGDQNGRPERAVQDFESLSRVSMRSSLAEMSLARGSRPLALADGR